MANYVSGQVTIGTSPTAIASPGNCLTMLISNGAGAAVFLGGPNVTTATGLSVAANTSAVTVPVAGDAQSPLYGVVGSTGTTVSYLYVV